MAKIVRAEQNFEIDRQPGHLTVTYRSVNRGRSGLSLLLTFGLVWVAGISGMALFLSALEYSSDSYAREAFQTSLVIFLISCASIFAVLKWGYKKRPTTVTVDASGVTKDNRKYLFSDIDDIGWQFGKEGPTWISSGTQAAALDAARAISGIVFITYGNKTITLVAGLSENETQRAFEVLSDAMNEMGASFGAS